MAVEKISFAIPGAEKDGRLFAPAAARNADAILAALVPHLPVSGNALEVASGTGEHVVRLAEATPGLTWQPTDIDPERLASIAAWTAHSGATNIQTPRAYNAVEEVWPGAPMDALYLSNLTHLISTKAADTLLSHLAGALTPGGLLAVYGPFKRGTGYASQGDERFDAAIRAQNPEAGYKDIGWVELELSGHRLIKHDTLAMPANNLLMLWRAPQ
jgi:trans-aconitate methyltransferase